MARRKNVKRIDPRYFLHETVNRNDDGSVFEVEEGVVVAQPKLLLSRNHRDGSSSTFILL